MQARRTGPGSYHLLGQVFVIGLGAALAGDVASLASFCLVVGQVDEVLEAFFGESRFGRVDDNPDEFVIHAREGSEGALGKLLCLSTGDSLFGALLDALQVSRLRARAQRDEDGGVVPVDGVDAVGDPLHDEVVEVEENLISDPRNHLDAGGLVLDLAVLLHPAKRNVNHFTTS